MKGRCENPRNHAFRWYGAKGVRVYPAWSADFRVFARDVGPRPSYAHSLDRYPDKAGNYEPGNVRWATREEQTMNRVDAVLYEYAGRSWTLPALARAHGMTPSKLRYRIVHKGLTPEAAIALS